ncbi:hypothetical protein C1645_373683 [Glomus cerebriforme]|uniref:Nucleoporin autopeptidase-domain-containing protein n=1 Tax=Glomus cerebriforme TaxID=658196 RepID=A0A397TNF3_9GLOM|nr:hypothetical protein C1645_373683 [Glomus cerebriforme]
MSQGFGFNQGQGFAFGKGGFQTPTTTPSTNPPFGNWQNSQQPTTPFGFGQQAQQTPSAFGTPSFGAFGQTQQQAQPGPSNAFGGTKSSSFGFNQSQTGGFGFGTSSGSSGFGFPSQAGTSSLQKNTPPFGIPGPSSAAAQGITTSSVQNIDPRLTGTREPKFEPFKDNEPTGVQTFLSISAMKAFRQWSPEELRLCDYELNRRPGVQQPSVPQQVPSSISTTMQSFQFPQQFQQQTAQQPLGQFPQQPQPQPQVQLQLQLQPQPQPQPFVQPQQFAQQQTPFAQQFAQQPTVQPQFAFQQNLQPQIPATIGTLNPYNYQYTGNLYYRLHGNNNPPPLVFETKLKPKVDKGKGKEFTIQPQQQLGPSSAITGPSFVSAIGDMSKIGQTPKSTSQISAFSTPTCYYNRTNEIVRHRIFYYKRKT